MDRRRGPLVLRSGSTTEDAAGAFSRNLLARCHSIFFILMTQENLAFILRLATYQKI